MEQSIKPVHVKPSYYAIMFEPLKVIALKYGYNLCLHGSLNRDMDLVAIPWVEELGDVTEMIKEFSEYVGGQILLHDKKIDNEGEIIGCMYSEKPHGRRVYVINIYRGGYLNGGGFQDMTYHQDPQSYIDISIF